MRRFIRLNLQIFQIRLLFNIWILFCQCDIKRFQLWNSFMQYFDGHGCRILFLRFRKWECLIMRRIIFLLVLVSWNLSIFADSFPSYSDRISEDILLRVWYILFITLSIHISYLLSNLNYIINVLIYKLHQVLNNM